MGESNYDGILEWQRCLVVVHIRVVTLLSSHVKVKHFCFCYCPTLSEPLQKKACGFRPRDYGLFCEEFSTSLCESPLSLVAQLSQTVQKYYECQFVSGCDRGIHCQPAQGVTLSLPPHSKKSKSNKNQTYHSARVHSSSIIHYLQTNRPLDNDHGARKPGASKSGRTEPKRRIGFLSTIHQTRLPGLMNGCSKTVAGLSLSESWFTSIRQINLTPGQSCRAASHREKKAQTDGCWWAPEDTSGETESTAKGCAWVRLIRVRRWPPREGVEGKRSFFQDEEKMMQSNSAAHQGGFAFCKIDRIW